MAAATEGFARSTQLLPMLSSSASAPSLSSPKDGSRSFSSTQVGTLPRADAPNRRDVANAALPMAASLHVPWKQLQVNVKAGTRSFADRMADRQRDSEVEDAGVFNLTLGSKGKDTFGSSFRKTWSTSKFEGVSPRADDMLKQTEQVQRLFSPAPAPALDVKVKGAAPVVGTPPKSGAKSFKPTARSSLSITKGCRLAQLIESGCIGLVRSSYFEDCMLHNRPVTMRQLIPNSFMWRGDEAVNLWWKHGKCFLMVVSYSWLSRDHPDPNQLHLRKLVRILEEYKKIWNIHEVAVIMDYCSLWQKGARTDTRTSEQKEQFNIGLRELNVAYAHKAITSVKLTEVPSNDPRKYEDRGWTLMEEILCDSKGGDWNRWTFGEFDPDSMQWTDSVVFFMQAKSAKLRPPLTPQKFAIELESRRQRVRQFDLPLFVNEKDNEEVPCLYEDIYVQLIHSTKLSYENADWSDEEALFCLEVIANCDRLERLSLANNRINVKAATEIARLIPSLPSLKYLNLSGNPLCQESQATDLVRLVWSREAKPMRSLIM
mmetsp:Transcript_64481/g.185359  ORF Transcript_64481/g.185359 Transcript_64481/m.185359 type:complete len:544 (+) Transcript_64481:152-1783(+)